MGRLSIPSGYTAERRMERRLIEDYRALIHSILEQLDQTNLTAAIELARAAADIGGYGPIKTAAVDAYWQRLKTLTLRYRATTGPSSS